MEATSTSPLTIQYVINPAAVWSDGVPVTADDFIYAWQSQRGDGVDVDGQPDQVASTLGYRNIASVTSSHNGKTVTVVFATPFTDWRVLFHDMVPAHIARRVGWNRGFDTFNPRSNSRPGRFLLQSVSSNSTRRPGPESQVVGDTGRAGSGDRRTCRQPGVVGPGARREQSNGGQPTDFDLGSLDAVSSLPNTQSFIKPSLNLMQLEFNVPRRWRTRWPPARRLPTPSTDGAAEPDLRCHRPEPGGQPGSPGHRLPAGIQRFLGSRRVQRPDMATTDRLLRSSVSRGSDGGYVDAAGKPLTLRMAVETGDPWISAGGSRSATSCATSVSR